MMKDAFVTIVIMGFVIEIIVFVIKKIKEGRKRNGKSWSIKNINKGNY